MATLAVQTPGLTGVTPTFNTLALGGDQFFNTGRVILHFKNTGGADVTVTINSQANCDQGFDHNVTLTVPLTSGEKVIGPFPKGRFDDASHYIQMTYSVDPSTTFKCALYETTP